VGQPVLGVSAQAAATLHASDRQVRCSDDDHVATIAAAFPLNSPILSRGLRYYDEARITLSGAINELAHMSHSITVNMRVQATSV
jgi:hypothetical protein